MTATCDAVLIHSHGVGMCELDEGHTGQHECTCWLCLEDGTDSILYWDAAQENWTTGPSTYDETAVRENRNLARRLWRKPDA